MSFFCFFRPTSITTGTEWVFYGQGFDFNCIYVSLITQNMYSCLCERTCRHTLMQGFNVEIKESYKKMLKAMYHGNSEYLFLCETILIMYVPADLLKFKETYLCCRVNLPMENKIKYRPYREQNWVYQAGFVFLHTIIFDTKCYKFQIFLSWLP